MLPTSHPAPIIPSAREAILAEAFAEFISAADRMEASYRELQGEVSRLRLELEERNAALRNSLAETQHIRTFLQEILDTLPCGVVVLNEQNTQVTLANPQARELLEVGAETGIEVEDLPGQVQGLLKTWGDEQEFAIATGDGKRWLSVRSSSLRQANESEQTILILRDITAKKQSEAQRETSRNLVALGEMAGVLAHEIRNPLASMELLTGLLASQTGLEQEPRQWIDHLQAGVRSLGATVNNVLRLHSAGCLNLVPVKVASFLRSSVSFVRPLAQQAEIKLKVETAAGEAQVAADESALQQVVLNLAINAFRHTDAGGTLSIAAGVAQGSDGQVARLAFTDNGKGIPPEALPHIFDAGFSTNRQSPGLGLAICQRIIEEHHGSIQVESTVGTGTSFIVELPVL